MSPFITTQRKYTDPSRSNMPADTAHVLGAVNSAAIALALCLVLTYVVVLNALVSHGYMVKNMQQHLGTLLENQETMARELAELRSPETLSLHVPALGLVEASQIAFPKPATVVARVDHGVLP